MGDGSGGWAVRGRPKPEDLLLTPFQNSVTETFPPKKSLGPFTYPNLHPGCRSWAPCTKQTQFIEKAVGFLQGCARVCVCVL